MKRSHLPPGVTHVHGTRDGFAAVWPGILEHEPDGLVDVMAFSRDDALAVLNVIGGGTRLLVLSSMDVYRASQVLRGHEGSDETQLDESAPLRRDRYPYRDPDHPDDDYEKLDVEEAYLARGANVLRLPMVYGEYDRQRREEFILRRVRRERTAIPIGAGDLVWSRGYVGDIGAATRLVMESDLDREVFNVCEGRTWPVREWAERIARAAGWSGEFVTVPDPVLPPDLRLTRAFRQHMSFDAGKLRGKVGWRESDPVLALETSVGWHLTNPPTEQDWDFTADDIALERRSDTDSSSRSEAERDAT